MWRYFPTKISFRVLSGNLSGSSFLPRVPFYSIFHSSVGLHPRAGGSSSVLVWGCIRLSLEVLPLGPAVLNTGTEITEVTRGSQESAGRETASSWSGLACSGVGRRAVTAQRERDLHSDVTWRRKRAPLEWQEQAVDTEHKSFRALLTKWGCECRNPMRLGWSGLVTN